MSRDLSHKYDTFLLERRAKELNPQQQWRAAGIYDFLGFKTLETLDDALQRDIPAAHLDTRNLVLFSFESLEPTALFLDDLEHPDNQTGDAIEHPIVAVSEITLSPSTYQSDLGHGCLLKSLANLIQILRASSPGVAFGDDTTYWGCLSGCDLVVVTRVRGPKELRTAHELASVARNLWRAEVRNGKFLPDKTRVSGGQSGEGHACAKVASLFAFRLAAASRFDEPAFKAEEKQSGVRYTFSLRVDCGHEHDVFGDILATAPEVQFGVGCADEPGAGVPVVWDDHTLCGHFDNLATFVRLWNKRWFDPAWRRRNLLGSATVLTLQDRTPVPDPGQAWPQSDELEIQLLAIERDIRSFGERFLNATQQADLESICSCLRSCFFRQNSLGTARDLLPFIRQLGSVLADVSGWQRFLAGQRKTPTEAIRTIENLDEFSEDLNDLISFVNRAVRNRIEQRSTTADPPFPHTVRDGVCKTVNAYSAVAYLCWELFRRGLEEGAPGEKVNTDHFAACVAAGTHGRIVCQELFEEFRNHSEADREAGPAEGLTGLRPARLLLLSISGRILMQPEYATVQLFHECAEKSEWLELPRCEALRAAVNRWVAGQATGYLHERLAAIVAAAGPVAERSGATEELCAKYVPWCLAADPDNWANLKFADVCAWFDKMLREQHPHRLVHHVIAALAETGAHPHAYGHFRSTMWSKNQKVLIPEGQFIGQAAGDGDLSSQLNQLAALVKELCADIGAWFALYHILAGSTPGLTADQRFNHVAKVFEGVLVMAREKWGGSVPWERVAESVLHRWAVQAAAVLPKGEDWQDRIARRFNGQHSGMTAEWVTAVLRRVVGKYEFEDERGLVPPLREFAPYGGSKVIPFVPIPPADRIAEAFRIAWLQDPGDPSKRPKCVSARLDLLNQLTAMSGRLAVHGMFAEARGGPCT